MQLKMINVLNKIIVEKKKLLNDSDDDVCENCGNSHDALEECSLHEDSSTASIAGQNTPLGVSDEPIGGVPLEKDKMSLKNLLNLGKGYDNTYKKYY